MKCESAITIMAMIIMIFIILPLPSFAIGNGYARIVYNVRGLQDYDLHWNDKFPQGSIIKIYAEISGINHKHQVAVDYIFIIKDSNGNIIDTAAYSNRYDDYRDNDFIMYSREIPQTWEDGVYKAEVYILDLLTDSLMDGYYFNLTSSYLNSSERPEIPVMNRSNATWPNASAFVPNQYIKIEKIFYVDKYANKFPVDRFRVENIKLDRTSIAPKESVHVSARVINTFYETGSTSVSLLLDNKQIDNATVELEGYNSSHVDFDVSTEIAGNHTLEIVPTGKNTIGLNLFAVFSVSTEKEIELPTSFNYKDIQIDRLSVEPNNTVTISVTVENKGRDGSQPIELYINDVLEETKEVHLNYSEIQDIKFNVTKADLGAYRVIVDKSNLSKIFFVESITATPTETIVPGKEKRPQFNYVVGLSILVILIYIVRSYLKKKLK